MIHHHVLHQVHAAAVQGAGELAVVAQRAEVRVDAAEILRPVAVVAAVAVAAVPPLLRHRRGDPQRRGAQAGDVVQTPAQAAQVTAAVSGRVGRVVLAAALVVVAGIAVVEAVGQGEVDDLLAPVGRRHVQRSVRCRLAAAGSGTTAGQQQTQKREQQHALQLAYQAGHLWQSRQGHAQSGFVAVGRDPWRWPRAAATRYAVACAVPRRADDAPGMNTYARKARRAGAGLPWPPR